MHEGGERGRRAVNRGERRQRKHAPYEGELAVMAVPESLKQQRAGRDGEENADEGQRPRPSQRRAVEACGSLRHVRRDEKNRGQDAAVEALRPHAEEHRSANRAHIFPRTWLHCDASRSMRRVLILRDARTPARPRWTTVECALLRMRTPSRPIQCASSQLCAARASTASGTESESAGIGACAITFSTTGKVFVTSASGTSNTSSSCTCSSICAESLAFASAASMRTMARRMMSAAVPCSRALIAARSLKARIEAFECAISG